MNKHEFVRLGRYGFFLDDVKRAYLDGNERWCVELYSGSSVYLDDHEFSFLATWLNDATASERLYEMKNAKTSCRGGDGP